MNRKAQFAPQYRSNNWIHIVFGIAMLLIIFANYSAYPTFKEAILTSVLDFDSSMSKYVDMSLAANGVTLITWLILAAYSYIYIYMFLLSMYYLFPQQGVMVNLIMTSIFIGLLHAVYFAFIQKNPFSISTISAVFPYSGLWHLLTNFGALTGETAVSNIIESANSSNMTDVNLDLT